MDNTFKNYSDMDISALVEGMDAGVLDYTFSDLKEVQTELVNRRMSSRYMGIISGLMREMIESGKVEETVVASNATSDSEMEDEKPEFIAPIPAAPIASAKKVKPEPVANAVPAIPAIPAIPAAPAEPEEPKIPTAPAPIMTFPKAPTVNNSEPAPRFEAKHEKSNDEYPTLDFLSGLYKVIAWVLVALTLGAYAYLAIEWLDSNIVYIICAGGAAMIASAIWLLVCYALSENLRWKINVAKMLKEKQ